MGDKFGALGDLVETEGLTEYDIKIVLKSVYVGGGSGKYWTLRGEHT